MSFRDKLAQKIQEREQNHSDLDSSTQTNEVVEAFEKSSFYGLENVRNSVYCIDLRLSNGSYKALPYSHLVEFSFSPSDGIEILTTTQKVKITGRNLLTLYHFLAAYRVKYIQANIGNDLTEQKALFVREIKIEEV